MADAPRREPVGQPQRFVRLVASEKQSGQALVCVLAERIFIERAARSRVARAAFSSPSRICALPSEASADARSKLVVAS
jgi:hypothetical protein